MKAPLLKKIFVCILLSSVYNLSAQDILLSKNAHVSILTCGTGNESYSLFGHTAIRISDLDNNFDVVYNYGNFDFNTQNFVLKFTKGDLDYSITNNRYVDFLGQYNYEKRDVYEQELNLPLELKQELLENLAKSMLSDERLYQYKFIDNNCTSKVVDVINKTLKGNVITKKTSTNQTYRSILFPYFNNHFYEKLGTSIVFGTKVDQVGTKIFLPFELQESLKHIRYKNQPLCKENKTILNFEEETPASWWNNSYTYLFILGFVTLINKRSIDYIYLSIISLLGLLFVFLGFYSFHQELEYNYNVLLFSPFILGVLYFAKTKNSKWTYKLSVFNILLLIVYCGLMLSKVHLLIVSPILLTNLFVLSRIAIRNKKRIPIII
ncbi:DUF4105 domain-containing protein [Flavobacterium marginilacus]|uniref:lipoprotein N-acyltransferase Lnb domain-containing protein n=1 Tax=Flavobacterium marginilacus TaxID=3003256 RepID=UPI00248E2470|nr:DUF4105 domain-containing protein [Flavobacterium marginilacus]